jgi:hypothetical protein
MGGGTRKRRQATAERRSGEAARRERRDAAEFKSEIGRRRELIGKGLPETMEATRTGATGLRETGGFRRGDVARPDIDLTGRGREGFTEFSETGGFAPGERESFLRRATAPTSAAYGHQRDELSRRLALQGGYMPGFGASQSRLTRQASQAGSEVSLGANVELAKQIRAGKEVGLTGLERTRGEAERERIAKERLSVEEESAAARGRVAAQGLLQRYTEFGLAALNQADIRELQNRLQAGNMAQADAQLLAALASQDRSLYENIISGAGAAAGIITAATPVPTAPAPKAPEPKIQ